MDFFDKIRNISDKIRNSNALEHICQFFSLLFAILALPLILVVAMGAAAREVWQMRHDHEYAWLLLPISPLAGIPRGLGIWFAFGPYTVWMLLTEFIRKLFAPPQYA